MSHFTIFSWDGNVKNIFTTEAGSQFYFSPHVRGEDRPVTISQSIIEAAVQLNLGVMYGSSEIEF